VPDCLFCHANRARYVEGSVNRYTPPVFDGHAIGCQRCHGPGELHEKNPGANGGVDYSLVNPRHLEPALREAVCQQCHLTGKARVLRRGRGLYDFRPGMPLESFWSVFVHAPGAGDGEKAVSHVEQMYQSRCFQGSAGPKQLGCISCHDPHERVPPAKRVSYYRGRCLQCHQQHGCSLPRPVRLRRSARDSCIDCHMRPYGSADIPHTASTDHRILRDGKQAGGPDAKPVPGDGFPVVSFYRPPREAGEGDRDRAVALVKLALTGEAAAFRALPRTLPALQAAVRRDPDDHVAGEARGHALGLQERRAEALAAFRAVLARAPDREMALTGAASMAEALGKTEAALTYWRQAVAANPWAPEYRGRLVLVLARDRAWDKALPECEAWLRLDPLSVEARTTRVSCLLAAGKKDEARTEFARIKALAPANLRELEIRFGKKLK
jgi:predicted CXXCH cytochrome family protein